MSRPTLLNGFHHYAQMPFGSGVVPAGPMYRLPMRAPELAAGYHQHQHQHTQQQHTGHYLGRASNLRMSGPAYMPSDEELAQLQKLSNEYDPEPTVSCPGAAAIVLLAGHAYN
jgi:ubiquitin thioesterase protein OTUB1